MADDHGQCRVYPELEIDGRLVFGPMLVGLTKCDQALPALLGEADDLVSFFPAGTYMP